MLEINILKKEFVTELIEFRKKHLRFLDYLLLFDLDLMILKYDPDYKNPFQLDLEKKLERD